MTRSTFFVLYLCSAILFLLQPLPSLASDIMPKVVDYPPVPSNRIILTVSSNGKEKQYSHHALEALGLKEMETTTYWPDDFGTYQGILLSDLLKDAGLENTPKIYLTALDDYKVDIPAEHWQRWPVMLATRHEGKPISIRKKGPIRIIYPKYLGGDAAHIDLRFHWIWAVRDISNSAD